MLFGPQIGKVAKEGDLMKYFFDSYDNLKLENGINIGWELIKRYFNEDNRSAFCSINNPMDLYRIKFLNPLKKIQTKKAQSKESE